MIIIQNKWINKIIPFPSFRACNLWGILFVRGERPLTEITINHENTHCSGPRSYLSRHARIICDCVTAKNMDTSIISISFLLSVVCCRVGLKII